MNYYMLAPVPGIKALEKQVGRTLTLLKLVSK